MNASSKKVLGALAAALMAGGLTSACSGTSKGDAGTTTTTGGGSTGGSSCAAASQSCTVTSDCCTGTGLVCSGGTCSTPCVIAGNTCSASSTCCAQLVCDSTSNTCLPAGGTTGGTGGTGGCVLSPALGGCITAADCAAPNVCQPASDGGGYCGPVSAAPSAVCLPNGQACSSGSGQPCCGGSCVGNVCVPRSACSVGGQGCNVAGDCCNFFTCVQGVGSTGGTGGIGGSSGGTGGVGSSGGTGGVVDGGDAGTSDDGGADAGTDGGTTDAGSTGGGTTDAGPTTPGGPTYTGTCQASCAPYIGSCNPADGNADCCSGLSCVTFSAGSICVAPEDATNTPTYCGGPCSALPCELGAPCQAPTAAGQVDPCASAGFACSQFGVCDNPSEQQSCIPGGPRCQPLADSTVTDLQCLQLPADFGGAYACSQPCALSDPNNGTSDCVDPLMDCIAIGGNVPGAECVPNAYATDCNGSPLFGPCNSAGVGDGVCMPINGSNGVGGYCWQATLDGGAPGSACNENSNRQNGGFCDTTSYCVFGVCQALCNSGTAGSPVCSQNDAGPTVGCQPFYYTGAQTGDKDDTGTCSADCDFTSPTGGGCQTVDGVPEKCLFPADLGLPDAPTGICVEAPAQGQAIAVGQPCESSDTLVDVCVDGAYCNFSGYSLTSACTQLCTNVSAVGQAPCNADQTCFAFDFGTPAAHEGYCALTVDGGFGG